MRSLTLIKANYSKMGNMLMNKRVEDNIVEGSKEDVKEERRIFPQHMYNVRAFF